MFPVLPTHRIVVFDGELLGEHGDEYATAIITWHDDYHPDSCVAWFETHFKDMRFKGMLCEIDNPEGPIDYGPLH
jgi:hypothetical protein